jgi:hypothetical protein
MTSPNSLLCSALTVFVCLTLSACSSPDKRREEFLAKVGPPQPSLIGKSDYFEGKVSVTAYFNPAFRPVLRAVQGTAKVRNPAVAHLEAAWAGWQGEWAAGAEWVVEVWVAEACAAGRVVEAKKEE